MENTPAILSMENIKNNETLLYFADLADDERIDELFDKGERVAAFDFIGNTEHDIHSTWLPKNFVDENNVPVTAFHAKGFYTKTDNSEFQLSLMATSGMTKRNIIINADADNNLFLYEVGTDNFEPINKNSFGDLSMRAANLDPSQIRKTAGIDKSSAIFDKIEDVYSFWCELSQERQGSTQVRGVYRHEINQQDGQTIEIRVAQNVYELPDKAIQELTIEHATQLHALDAEIVYRLELTYESNTNHERAFLAEKRVVSGCGNELVNARLTSRDSSGVTTPLDIEDTTLMKQLQGALEIALQAV